MRVQVECEHTFVIIFFFFNDTATTEIYTLSLHDALPISPLTLSVVLLRWLILSLVFSFTEDSKMNSVVYFLQIGRAHV